MGYGGDGTGLSIGRQHTTRIQFVNNQHMTKAGRDSPQGRVASVPSCSSGPSDQQAEEALAPSERLGGRDLEFYGPVTSRTIGARSVTPLR